jgi:hypothetical protein
VRCNNIRCNDCYRWPLVSISRITFNFYFISCL